MVTCGTSNPTPKPKTLVPNLSVAEALLSGSTLVEVVGLTATVGGLGGRKMTPCRFRNPAFWSLYLAVVGSMQGAEIEGTAEVDQSGCSIHIICQHGCALTTGDVSFPCKLLGTDKFSLNWLAGFVENGQYQVGQCFS